MGLRSHLDPEQQLSFIPKIVGLDVLRGDLRAHRHSHL